MTPERYQRIKDICGQVVDLSCDERDEFLSRACSSDPALRIEVEALLKQDVATALVSQPISPAMLSEAMASADQGDSFIGRRVDGYVVHSLLGEGGLGKVYLAHRDTDFQRQVALKIIKPGMDTLEVVRRFKAERQALALMDHPNVAKVFDAGATDEGLPYFVMEHVPGEPITTYCDRHRLSLKERLKLLIQVCDGVQHAHFKSIVHRDIKPSNIMVSVKDNTLLVRIIDFGVAKSLDRSLAGATDLTECGQMIGTPEYMSPEQAETTALDIDTRTDVYSIGVILYELITGVLPFDPKKLRQSGYTEMRRILREEEPPKPGGRFLGLDDEKDKIAHQRSIPPESLARQLRGDLAWITAKAMDKDRTRRYATPAELSADIRCYLNDHPVAAGPPSSLYRVKKFARRHKRMIATVSILTLATVVGLLGIMRQRNEARRAREEATAETVRKHAMTELTTALLKAADPNVERRTMLDEAVSQIESMQIDDPLTESDLHGIIGNNYLQLGLLEQAEHQLRAALAITQREHGPEHIKTTLLEHDLALLYLERGDYAAAERKLREVLAKRRKQLGDEHALVAESINSLAGVVENRGDYGKAERLYREALQMSRGLFGTEHEEVAAALNNLAGTLRRKGDYASAELSYRDALQIHRRLFGEKHLKVATSLNNLGRLYVEKGDLARAKPLLLESLESRRELLGDHHLDVANSLETVARWFHGSGDDATAVPLQREALKIRQERALGEDHPLVAQCLNDLAVMLKDMEHHAEAEPLARKALAMYRRLNDGKPHPHIASSLSTLASVLEKSDNFKSAEPVYRECIAAYRALDDGGGLAIGNPLLNLGQAYLGIGDTVSAEPLLQEALQVLKRGLPEGHWMVAYARGALGDCLGKSGRFDEAEPILLDSYAQISTVLPNKHGARIKTLERVVALYTAWNKSDEAEKWRRKASE